MGSGHDNREIVRQAFEDWTAGRRHVSVIFAEDMTWEIVGRSAVSRRYATKQDFVDQVLTPFATHFGAEDPFRPVVIRSILADGDTVVVTWDGQGTTTDGATYANTYAWIMRMDNGLVIEGTAFFDSIAFNQLWLER